MPGDGAVVALSARRGSFRRVWRRDRPIVEAAGLRREAEAGRAGSRRHHSGWQAQARRRACPGGRLEDLDDDHATAAARAWWPWIGGRVRCRRPGRHRDREKLAGPCDIGLAARAGEQTVMADAVKALGQDVHKKTSDEFVGVERHGALAVSTAAAIILVSERHARLVGRDQAVV